MKSTILIGDVRDRLEELTKHSVRTCVTSPPYFGLRDYGVEGQMGLERTLEDFIDQLTSVMHVVHNALTPDGTLWLNLGDTYHPNGQLLGVPWAVAFAMQDLLVRLCVLRGS